VQSAPALHNNPRAASLPPRHLQKSSQTSKAHSALGQHSVWEVLEGTQYSRAHGWTLTGPCLDLANPSPYMP